MFIQALAQKSVQEKESIIMIISVRYGQTNLSLGSRFGITRQSLVMPNSDAWDRFVCPYLTLMSDTYSLFQENKSIQIYERLTHWTVALSCPFNVFGSIPSISIKSHL